MTTTRGRAARWIAQLAGRRRRQRARRELAIGICEHLAYWRARGWFPWNL